MTNTTWQKLPLKQQLELAQNGQKKYMTEIEAQSIQLLGAKGDAQQSGNGSLKQQPQPQTEANPFNNNLPEEDDLPF